MRKNLLLTSLTVIMAFLSLTSCDNEPLGDGFPENIDPNPDVEANFQVDIDSVTFVADHASMNTQNGVTMINGIKNNGTTVTMMFAGSGTGTYILGDTTEGGSAAGYSVQGEIPYVVDVEAGSENILKVTQYDVTNGLASGTFSFTVTHTIENEEGEEVTETVELTNGSFENIELESDVEPEPPQGDFNFEVKLDGEQFTGEEITGASLNEDGLLISATMGNKEIGFQIFNPEVGIYDISADDEGLVLYDPNNTDDESPLFSSSGGTLEITELDMENGTVSGTFSGTLTEAFGSESDIEMTEGVFENIQFSTAAPTEAGTALIDGEEFNANVFPKTFLEQTVQVDLDNNLNEVISLRLPEDLTPGTYAITTGDSTTDFSAVYRFTDADGNEFYYNSVADSGEIVIDSVESDIVTGTFNFTGEAYNGDTVEVTEGEFTVDISF